MTDRHVAWWRSLRLRFAAALALIAATAALVIGTVVAHGDAISSRERLRSQASDALAVAVTAYEFDSVMLGNAAIDPLNAPGPLVRAASADQVSTYFTGSSMWAAQRVGGHLITVQLSAHQFHADRRAMARLLGMASLGSLLFAAGAGWLIASSLTSRLRRAATLIEHERRTGERVRLGSEGDSDEVAELTGRIDELADSLWTSLERERAFSADVAHELRTPMTALVSASELLGDGSAETLVRRQVRRLRDLIDDLLSLFRTESGTHPPRPVDVDVAALLGRLIHDHPELEPEHIDISRARRLLVDPQHLERIAVNLLANARRHGAAPVTLIADRTHLEVKDGGIGFPDELLSGGPRRFATYGRSAGSGLGLAIAQSLAVAGAMTITLTNPPEGGASAKLTYPPE